MNLKAVKMLAMAIVFCLVLASAAIAVPQGGKGKLRPGQRSGVSKGLVNKPNAQLGLRKGLVNKPDKPRLVGEEAEGSNVESDTPKGKKPAFGAIVGRTVLILKDESSSVESSATPLSGAHLRLMVKKGKKLLPAGAARSGKDGNFIFKKVKPGSYRLTAWAKGFKPKNPSVIVKVERGNITKAPIFYFYAVPNNHPNAALKSRPVTPPVSEDNSPTASGT